MKTLRNQAGSAGMIVAVVVAVVAIGFISYAVINKKSDNNTTVAASNSANTQKASDLRANLVTMGVEHMFLTDIAVRDALSGAKTASASGAALYANGNDIGAAVGSVYGKDAETTFDTVWKLHLDQFVAYAGASAKNDDAGKKAALSAIDTGYTKPLAAYLAKANPNLPEATLYSGLDDHVQMTATLIDDIAKGDGTAEQTDLKAANTHIEGLFSTLAGGIVKQYPDKFKD